MRQLKITQEMVDLHLAAYDEGIMRGLEELVAGRPLKKWYKKNRKKTRSFISRSKTNSFEMFYIKRIYRVYKKYQGKKGFLAQGPSVIDVIVRRFKKLDKIVKAKFSKTEYAAWERGKEKIEKLFDYEMFSQGKRLNVNVSKGKPQFRWDDNYDKWSGWYFLKRLSMATCSYCNSDGVFTLEYKQETQGRGKRKAQEKPNHLKSELDHFWPRAEFPFLGLSLYNLVPSCTRCNRNIKGANYEPLGEMIHPYSHDFHEGAKFYAVFKDYKGLTHPNDTDVDVIIDRPNEPHSADLAKRAKKSAEFFHLEEVYNQIYELEVNDVVRKVLYLPESYLADLRSRYPGIEESVLNRMTLGTSLNPADINKLPHEKLRQDIHSQLWIHSSVTKSCMCGRTR